MRDSESHWGDGYLLPQNISVLDKKQAKEHLNKVLCKSISSFCMHSSFYCYTENDKIANRTIRLHGHKVIMCITAWLIVQPLNILPGTDITFAFYHSTLVSIPPQSSLCHSPSELSVAWVFPALFVLPAWPVWPMELVDGATGLVADSTVQHGSTQLSGRSDGVSKTPLMSLHGGQGGHVGKQISSHHWLSKKYEYAYRHTHTHHSPL